VLEKGKACSRGSCTGELWVNKACGARWALSSPWRSAYITPAATASWQQWAGKPQPQIAIHRTVSRLFFFPLSLPLMRKQLNYTCMLKNLLKLYCIWTWDTLWVFLFFVFYLFFCAVLFYFMHPLWWDNYRITSEAPSPGLETETDTKIIKTETSFHLNLEGFFSIFHFVLFYFYIYITFIYLFFIFILIFILFIFYFQSSLCLSKACSPYCQLVQQHSLFIPLKLCLIPYFLFSYLSVCFSLFFNLFPSPLTLPFYINILIITS
jgi:hypothetical protein